MLERGKRCIAAPVLQPNALTEALARVLDAKGHTKRELLIPELIRHLLLHAILSMRAQSRKRKSSHLIEGVL
jgi:hypothetical protein